VKDLVRWLAEQLVDDKAAVQVHATERDRATVLELSVASADLGRVIGRGGKTARALRTVVEAAARLQGRRAALDIVD
jgi:predicted RNA-binding protein YlqC (UPF0109 family)